MADVAIRGPTEEENKKTDETKQLINELLAENHVPINCALTALFELAIGCIVVTSDTPDNARDCIQHMYDKFMIPYSELLLSGKVKVSMDEPDKLHNAIKNIKLH